MITTMAAPVYDEHDQLLGVIGIDIRINDIESHIAARTIGETGYALLVDSNGKLLTLPTSWQMDDLLVDLSEVNVDLDLIDENKVHLHQILHQDTGSLIYTDVILDEYELIVFMPDNEFYVTQVQFGRYFVVVFVLINVIGITFFLLNRRYIFIPLVELDQEIAKIDLSQKVSYRLPIESKDRFLDIKSTLNQALDAAEVYFNENATKAEELYLRSQRFKLLIDSTQDFIIQISPTHVISSAYGKGLAKIGLEEEDMIGRKMEDCF